MACLRKEQDHRTLYLSLSGQVSPVLLSKGNVSPALQVAVELWCLGRDGGEEAEPKHWELFFVGLWLRVYSLPEKRQRVEFRIFCLVMYHKTKNTELANST